MATTVHEDVKALKKILSEAIDLINQNVELLSSVVETERILMERIKVIEDMLAEKVKK